MSTLPLDAQASAAVQSALRHAGIESDIVVREYPGEMILVVSVSPEQLDDALQLGNALDAVLRDCGVRGFVTLRPSDVITAAAGAGKVVGGVHDRRASELIRLVSARSRASEIQPSLTYIRDAAAHIATVTTARHHIVFGRRGAGKTALLVEAKRVIERGGALTVWVNMQTLQRLPPATVFFWIVRQWVEVMVASLAARADTPAVAAELATLLSELEIATARQSEDEHLVSHLVPRVQRIARRFEATQAKVTYIFLDDFHYLPRSSQPALLDSLHGCMRDCSVWMKIAAIKHLAKWYQPSPPLGLQTGQDAELIDLDLSLEDPSRAKEFLEKVLQAFAVRVGVKSLFSLFTHQGLDRLVLASGAVPRDYLLLAAEAIRRAGVRPKGRLVGAQDVNRAAGDAAQVKISELEEDLAANAGEEGTTLGALSLLRTFCLDEARSSYFRVDFADKERSADAYAALTSLLALRLVHLVNASVSDEHKAGARSEVFMLDLSQFSGQRFKKNIRVLDFRGKHLTVHQTGVLNSTRVGTTPKLLLAILRRSPLLPLSRLVDRPTVQVATTRPLK